MPPIFSYLCSDCQYEFDKIQSHNADRIDCPRCEAVRCAYRIPSVCSTPRGNFGTTRRDTSKDKVPQFNFAPDAQMEFDFKKKEE